MFRYDLNELGTDCRLSYRFNAEFLVSKPWAALLYMYISL